MKIRKLLSTAALGTAVFAATVSAQSIDPRYSGVDFSKPPEGLGRIVPSRVTATQTAKVTGVGRYSNGQVFVMLDRDITSCPIKDRLDLPPGHPRADDVQDLALAAMLSGRELRIRAAAFCYQFNSGSNAYSGTLTDNPTTWMFVQN